MSDLFHIQTRRLWNAISCGDACKAAVALNKGASINSWRLDARENYALNENVEIDFFQRPVLAAALANRYDIVNLLLSDPTVKVNAVYAVKPSLNCSLNDLAGACELFGGWDDVIQDKFSKLKRPRRFFFSLEDIVRLNEDSEKKLCSCVSQIRLDPRMASFLERKIKRKKLIARNTIPNLANVFSHLFEHER